MHGKYMCTDIANDLDPKTLRVDLDPPPSAYEHGAGHTVCIQSPKPVVNLSAIPAIRWLIGQQKQRQTSIVLEGLDKWAILFIVVLVLQPGRLG